MPRYLIVIEKTEHNFSAYSPDLLGCVSTGRTIEETKRMMAEAMEMHISSMKEDGLPIPEPSSLCYYVEIED